MKKKLKNIYESRREKLTDDFNFEKYLYSYYLV